MAPLVVVFLPELFEPLPDATTLPSPLWFASLAVCPSSVNEFIYVKEFALVAVPPGVVTETAFAPTVPAGVRAVMEVEDTTTTLVAATPAIFTIVAPVKLVPVIVIAVEPAVEPVFGFTEAIVGAAK